MNKYVQYKAPDQEALREQINKARGEQTMAKFAETIKYSSPNIKVSASTLSRVCNWNSSTPVSMDLIQAIAAVADKDSGVTLESLAQANGMRTEVEEKRASKKSNSLAMRRELLGVVRECREIIQDEIFNRGYFVRRIPVEGSMYRISELKDRAFPRRADFGYAVSGMEPCNTWKFAVCTFGFSYSVTGMMRRDPLDIPYGTAVAQILTTYACVFASDSYESEMWEGEKYSFIFIDEKLYYNFVNTLQKYDIRVNGLMTIIFIDIEKRKVVEEIQVERYDGEKAPRFFSSPLLQDGDDDCGEDEYAQLHFDFDEEDEE